MFFSGGGGVEFNWRRCAYLCANRQVREGARDARENPGGVRLLALSRQDLRCSVRVQALQHDDAGQRRAVVRGHRHERRVGAVCIPRSELATGRRGGWLHHRPSLPSGAWRERDERRHGHVGVCAALVHQGWAHQGEPRHVMSHVMPHVISHVISHAMSPLMPHVTHTSHARLPRRC